jgi:hypothetical protein
VEIYSSGDSAVATMSKGFDELIAEAERQQLEGWDFSYLEGRMAESPLPFDYLAEVRQRLSGVSALLDLGTGGENGGHGSSKVQLFRPVLVTKMIKSRVRAESCWGSGWPTSWRETA